MTISKEVEMLLNRMDTHPEEFVGEFNVNSMSVDSRWSWAIRSAMSHIGELFTEEDAKAIREKYNILLREEVKKAIIRELVSGENPKWDQLNLPYVPGISTVTVK